MLLYVRTYSGVEKFMTNRHFCIELKQDIDNLHIYSQYHMCIQTNGRALDI